MDYLVMVIVGFVSGGVSVFFGLDHKRRALDVQKTRQHTQITAIQNATKDIDFRRSQLEAEISQKQLEFDETRDRAVQKLKMQRDQMLQEISSRESKSESLQSSAMDALRKRQQDVERQIETSHAQLEERRCNAMQMIAEQQQELDSHLLDLKQQTAAFDAQVIKYNELRDENAILKSELRKVAVRLNKLHLDGESERQRHDSIAEKVEALGSHYLKENVKWIGKALNANNFASCKDRLLGVIERCRQIGLKITQEDEETLINELRTQYEMEVRAAFEREEQARIRAQIREDQKREREIQRELERVERERSVLQAALTKALAEARDEHSAEIESLKARLADAEARERAISQAQLTKAGFVYVISNVGSFGEGVFKIGMTRRLEPLDRVKELGDASVPFPFDIHMLVSCENAPALENALHRNLLSRQINRTNPRKEFFRTDIETIASIVRENHGEVQYVADAEALQYRQSLTMSDEDQEFIEHVFDDVEDESELIEDGA